MKTRRHSTEKLGRKPKTSENNFFGRIKNTPSEAFAFLAGLGKNTKLALALVIVLLAVGGLVSLLGSNDSPDDTFTSQSPDQTTEENKLKATADITEGTVEFKNQQGNWATVSKSDELMEGDDLRTVGAASRASLTFENGSIVRIDANSEVQIETANTERIVIKQSDGYSFSRVSAANTTSYIVKTTDAQYEATGTAFYVISNGDEQAVEVYENTVIETSTNQKVEQGNKLTVRSNVDKAKNGKMTKIDIEIAKNNSFIAWNRALDAENEEFKDKLGFLSDIVSPSITISSPADNETILLEPSAEKGTIEFVGKTEPNTTITIISKSSSTAASVKVTADSAGNFTSPIIEAPLGSSVFEFTAADKAGNKTSQSIRLTFQRKSAPIETASGIKLTQEETDKTITFSWVYTGSATASDGVKLVYSSSKTPIYPADSLVYIESGTNTTVKKSDLKEDKNYEFRVCIYNKNADTCSTYSNSIKVSN